MSSSFDLPLSPAWVENFLAAERLPAGFQRTIEQVHVPLAQRIAAAAKAHGACLTVGLCGSQGSGKSTMTVVLKALLEAYGFSVAAVSLDDFYLTRAARMDLGRRVHPLLQTRGVPGTHEVTLGMDVFAALRSPPDAVRRPTAIALPAFDKSRDDRKPREAWPEVQGPVQVILFEGWCVGAVAQSETELAEPINALERDEDPAGLCRRYVNDALAGPYRQWYSQIDFLVLLQAPSFEVVYGWRLEQEQKLRQRIAGQGGDLSRVMSEAEVLRFISHYERLTRHILAEMPARADAVVKLDETRALAARGLTVWFRV